MSTTTRLDALPTELIVEVFTFLPIPQVSNVLPQVNRLFYVLVFSDFALWKELYRVNKVIDRYMIKQNVLQMLQTRMDNGMESGHRLMRSPYLWNLLDFENKEQVFEKRWDGHLKELANRIGIGAVQHRGVPNVMFEYLTTGNRGIMTGAQWMKNQWDMVQRDAIPFVALLVHYFGANGYIQAKGWPLIPRYTMPHLHVQLSSLDQMNAMVEQDLATRFPCVLRMDLEVETEGKGFNIPSVDNIIMSSVDVYRFNTTSDTLNVHCYLGNEKVRYQYNEAKSRFETLKYETTDALLRPIDSDYTDPTFSPEYSNKVFVEVEGDAYLALRSRPFSQAVTIELWIDVHRLQPVLDLDRSVATIGSKSNPLSVIPIRWELLCNQYYRGRLAHVALSNQSFDTDYGHYTLVTRSKLHDQSTAVPVQKKKHKLLTQGQQPTNENLEGLQQHRPVTAASDTLDSEVPSNAGYETERKRKRRFPFPHRRQENNEFYLSNTVTHLLDWSMIAEQNSKYLSQKQFRKRRFNRFFRALEQDQDTKTNIVHMQARIVCTSGPYSLATTNMATGDNAAYLLPVKMNFLHRSQRGFLVRLWHGLKKSSPMDLMLYAVITFWLVFILLFIVLYIVALSVGLTVTV